MAENNQKENIKFLKTAFSQQNNHSLEISNENKILFYLRIDDKLLILRDINTAINSRVLRIFACKMPRILSD